MRPHAIHTLNTSQRGWAWLVAAGGLVLAQTVPARAACTHVGPGLAAGPAAGQARARADAGRVEAWVVLKSPGTAALPAGTAAQRQSNLSQVQAAQSALMQTLAAMGAVERGRQTLTRSAVLIEVDAAALQQIADLPGVLRVQPVVHLHRTNGASAPR